MCHRCWWPILFVAAEDDHDFWSELGSVVPGGACQEHAIFMNRFHLVVTAGIVKRGNAVGPVLNGPPDDRFGSSAPDRRNPRSRHLSPDCAQTNSDGMMLQISNIFG
jgi:hypothetical protein